MSDETALTKPTDPMSFIPMAIEKGYGPEQIGQLVKLVEIIHNKNAEAAYNRDMNAAQQEMPTVIKEKINPETRQPYAPVEDVQAVAKPVYSRHGFSLSLGTEPGTTEGFYNVVCDCLHRDGHSKRYHLYDVPRDDKGPKGGATKSAIQGQMSSMSYAMGRLIRMIFNITVAGEDKDGQKFLTEDQIFTINTLLEQCRKIGVYNDLSKKFFQWAADNDNAESLADVPATRYGRVMTELTKKLAEKAGAEK